MHAYTYLIIITWQQNSATCTHQKSPLKVASPVKSEGNEVEEGHKCNHSKKLHSICNAECKQV